MTQLQLPLGGGHETPLPSLAAVPPLPTIVRYYDDFARMQRTLRTDAESGWVIEHNGAEVSLALRLANSPMLDLVKVALVEALTNLSPATAIGYCGVYNRLAPELLTGIIRHLLGSSPTAFRQRWIVDFRDRLTRQQAVAVRHLARTTCRLELGEWRISDLSLVRDLPGHHLDKYAGIRDGSSFLSGNARSLIVEFIDTVAREVEETRPPRIRIRDAAILAISFQFGLRTKQIASIEPEDLKFFENGALHIRIGLIKHVSVGRPGAALEASMDRLGEISGQQILTLIDGYLDQINKSEAETLDGMATYRLQLIFEHLDKSDDVPLDAIAKREFAMLPLLQHSKRPLALYGLMASSGVFYASVLDLVFPPDAADDLSEDEKKRRRDLATLAYRLLSEFKAAPGTDGKGADMTRSSLETWIAEVRSANSMPDRQSLFDVYIGHALAHSPQDDDGAWPHRVVRDTLEALAAPDIERGISTERINMRGVYTKLLFEGGRQERDLAATYRAWRDLAAAWPRTSELLETIAKRWDLSAEDADIRAKQDMMRD